MIFHRKEAGAIRTQATNTSIFECALCASTWTAKLDVWQDCAPSVDVPNDVKVAMDVAAVKALPEVRSTKLPRVGTVLETVLEAPVDVPVDVPVDEVDVKP